ncbi:DUF6988 family protein, partial [Arenimonas malthae]|uniref:DUF6988 family protein n=1 Tax=Arenimonas malthae TaxID=354197 RepID=UPI001B80552A
EHHGAILSLAREGRRSSLLALVRPTYEACIWTIWLFRVASGDHLLELARNRLSPGLEKMIQDLDRGHFSDAPMLNVLRPLIKRMNGMVHGGFEHLRYRIHREGVVAKYPDDLIAESLRLADLAAVMTLLEWPALVDDLEMGSRLYEEAQVLLGIGGRGVECVDC